VVSILKKKSANPEKKTAAQTSSKTRFWSGLVVGIFLVLFLYTFLLYAYVTISGFRIVLDQKNVALLIKERVKAEVAKELPVLVSRIKYEIPREIEANLEDFNHISIRIGDGSIDLPPEAAGVFREEFRVLAEAAILDTLDTLELTPYVEDLGQAAYYLAEQTLNDEVIGKTYRFNAHPWLSVPITVIGE